MNTDHKQKLEEERATLTAELKALGKRNPENDTWEAKPETADANEADSNSNADRFEDYEEKSATIAPLEARLAQVENALAKIENNSFGTCAVCGNAIEEERLHANPAAETCMKHLEA